MSESTANNEQPARLKVVFVTDRALVHQKSALATAPPGVEVTMLRRPERETLRHHLGEAQVLVTERQGRVDAGLIAAAPKLKLIQRLGSMIHDIDLDAAHAHGIAVCRHPLLTCMAVAEHALMLILALLKRLPEMTAIALAAGDWGPSRRTDENTFAFNWSRRENIDCLAGKTVGILGFGEIGAELARRLGGFSSRSILYHKRTPLPAAAERELGIVYTDRDSLIHSSEILVVLLPYTTATHHLMDSRALQALPQGALLVHCGSGGIIDEQALATELSSGHLTGSALDTFEWEPLQPDNPLLPLAREPKHNVLLTPHTAAGTRELARREYRGIWDNVQRLLAGQALKERVI